jgi:hypothetical protein
MDKIFKTILSLVILAAGIAAGFFMVRIFPGLGPKIEPKIITVTKPKIVTVTEPPKIVYLSVPSPVPVPIEKIVFQDGQISFQQDVPFEHKIITASADIEFSGTHHVVMENDLLSVNDEIKENVKVTMRIPEKPLPLNELGLFCSTESGGGIYYRRYFYQVLMIRPWAEIRASFAGLENSEISIGFQVKF